MDAAATRPSQANPARSPARSNSGARLIDKGMGRGYVCTMVKAKVRTRRVAVAWLALVVAPGCGTPTLETGYAPRPLSDTGTQRRGYYAGPFSKEAREAERVQLEAMNDARPVVR